MCIIILKDSTLSSYCIQRHTPGPDTQRRDVQFEFPPFFPEERTSALKSRLPRWSQELPHPKRRSLQKLRLQGCRVLSWNRPSAETRSEQTKLSFLLEMTQLLGSIPLPIREGGCVGVCVAQFWPCRTLCDPMDCSPPGSSVLSRQEC